MNRTALTAAACAALIAAGPAAAATPQPEMMREVMPVFVKGLEQFQGGKDVERRTFAEVLTFRDSKFQRIVRECFEIMADSDMTDLMDALEGNDAAVRKKQARISELVRESITAPESSKNPFATTQESIRRDTARLKAEIAELSAERERAKDKAFKRIRANGVELTRQQFDQMLSTADAPDIANIMAVADNIKFVLRSVEQKASQPEAPVELIKTYSGVYMMCYRVYLYALEFAVKQIDESYKPRLKDIAKQNDKLLADARDLSRQGNTDRDSQALKANMASLKRMLEVVQLYGRYLSSQKASLEARHKEISKRYRVAENTYHTIRLSS
ncbi:MAG: hypothetical protein HUK26_09145, partial [Duodenibacillus sp.]|nr:hypothetical protein [Duodenibacillus sp.]